MCTFVCVTVHGQVSSLGCKYFALLFDDIDDDLCPEDMSRFSSPAEAQCSITNDVYDYLKQPDIFLFCPTGLPISFMMCCEYATQYVRSHVRPCFYVTFC